MKWAKPSNPAPIYPSKVEESQPDDDQDFNAPLSEESGRCGGAIVEDAVALEREIDLMDVEEAERRLANPAATSKSSDQLRNELGL